MLQAPMTCIWWLLLLFNKSFWETKIVSWHILQCEVFFQQKIGTFMKLRKKKLFRKNIHKNPMYVSKSYFSVLKKKKNPQKI